MKNLILKTRQELDLLNQQAVIEFFKNEQPEYVFLAAVLPCGAANVSQRADFIYENITIQNNIIHQSFKFGVKKLVFLVQVICILKNSQPYQRRKYVD